MSKEKMLSGARKLINTCVGVRTGEKVLVVTDTDRSFGISEAVFAAALEAGAEKFTVLRYPPAFLSASIRNYSDVFSG